jgi:lathosterol oxidase
MSPTATSTSNSNSAMKKASLSKTVICFRTAVVAIVLLLAAAVAICAGGGSDTLVTPHHNRSSSVGVDEGVDPVPFPGSFWLHQQTKKSRGASITELWSAPYEHILGGDPAQHLVKNFNCYINSFVIPTPVASWVVSTFGRELGHYILCYLRNIVGALLVYYGTASFFHYHCYVHPRSKLLFQNRPRPSVEVITDQILLAQKSMFLYVLLPVVSDYVIENGWTQTYYSLHEVGGLGPYLAWLVLYLALVEIGIYWMHRTLHTNKFLYRHIHALHHKYKTPEMLTPWASIAFHPLDGILQACPYVLCLFLVPCHYITHVLLLFFTAIWATYIHDSLDIWNIDPIMGSKYHTIHHTHYMYNFGQVFIFCDAFWGTLRATPFGAAAAPDTITSSNQAESHQRVKKKES